MAAEEGTPSGGGGGEYKIDLSNFLDSETYQAILRMRESTLVRIGRSILPAPFQELLNKWGWNDLPTNEMSLPKAPMELSTDGTVVGFHTDRGETDAHMFGFSIISETGNTAILQRSVLARQDDGQIVANVPEGPYSVQLVAPQPWHDTVQHCLVYYSAQVILMAERVGEMVIRGTDSGFTLKRKPISWMVLNEWRQGGVLRHAVRQIPGIYFPSGSGENESLVLKLVSLQSERSGELPENVITGTGIVGVQFIENHLPVEGYVRQQGRTSAAFPFVDTATVSQTFHAKSFQVDDGLTVLSQARAAALQSDASGITKLIGEPIVCTVKTDASMPTERMEYPETSIVEHRRPEDDHPALRALGRWGLGAATREIQRLGLA